MKLFITQLGFVVLLASGLVASVSQLRAQDDAIKAPLSSTLIFTDPTPVIWEFGLKISSSGQANGITATVPIPMEWPEQSITAAIEKTSENISNLKINHPTPESRQMVLMINRLNAGEIAEATVRFEIDKKMIEPPIDTKQLSIPTSLPAKLKTFLKPSPQIESKHKRIREIAAQLQDDRLTDWEQVEAIYHWVRENIDYKFDTEIHTCIEALDAGRGDCEELSSLFIAVCRAMKIPARAVWIPGHTYPEFYLEDENGNGAWFPCQAAGEYQFGQMSEQRPILQKGDRFRLAGKSGYVRYLQPSLVAKDADGEISIEWISNEIKQSDK